LPREGVTAVAANEVTELDCKNFRELYWQAIPVFDTPESFRRMFVAAEWSRLVFFNLVRALRPAETQFN
jgi:hypothetical protein